MTWAGRVVAVVASAHHLSRPCKSTRECTQPSLVPQGAVASGRTPSRGVEGEDEFTLVAPRRVGTPTWSRSLQASRGHTNTLEQLTD